MPSLSQLLDAHFQVIEIHWKVWLICEYRLAPLPPRQSCLLGSLPLLKIQEISGTSREKGEELAGGGDEGVALILGLLMNLITANTRLYPGGLHTG